MKKNQINKASDEALAAFLDGNATAQESQAILDALSDDAGLRELLRISQMVDEEMGVLPNECELIPMAAMAASCDEGAFCCLECEKYVLTSFGVGYDEEQIMTAAVHNGWSKEAGTALHNVGRHLEDRGLIVTRRYKSSVIDIVQALNDGEKVIVAVDGGELLGNMAEERTEDLIVGKVPDHTVVVLSVDMSSGIVMVYDPNSTNEVDEYPMDVFEDAWEDSMNYLVTVSQDATKPYTPRPIDLADVELPASLDELREAIAENAHDVWALERQAQGWTYGPSRDDHKKQTPCMVPYSQLPDSEKKFDRDMAMNTLKLLRKLGYDIVKLEDK